MCRTSFSQLLARTNSACQTAVVDSVVVVPQGLSEFHTSSQNFDLLLRASRCIGGQELPISDGIEVLIVTVLENGFENIFTKIAHTVWNLLIEIRQIRAPGHASELSCIGLFVLEN